MYVELKATNIEEEEIIKSLKNKQKTTYNNNKIKISWKDTLKQELNQEINIDKLFDCNGKEYDGAYWRSYDQNSHNFHIVPNAEVPNAERQNFLQKNGDFASCLKNENKLLGSGCGNPPWTKQHKYNYIQKGEYKYLIGCQTLTYDKNDVNCYLNRIQFMRFRGKPGNINWDKDNNFKMMYPPFDFENYSIKYDPDTGHCVVNTTLVYNEKNFKEIAEAFEEFINAFKEADKQPYYKQPEKCPFEIKGNFKK